MIDARIGAEDWRYDLQDDWTNPSLHWVRAII